MEDNTIHGYKVRKFNIKEYAELGSRFKNSIPEITKISDEELTESEQVELITSLIINSLPDLIVAVSYATDRPVEEIEKIDDMQVFGDLILAIKQVNDFLGVQKAVGQTMERLFK